MILSGILTIVLFVLTMGCGFAIHFGDESFKNAIKGHMVLALMTFLSLMIFMTLFFVR